MTIEIQDTRAQIVHLLKKQPGLTVNELAEKLDISAMGVRQHLAVLERDGLVTFTRERPHRGRPVHRYSLTREADRIFPNSYENFALSILRATSIIDGEDHIKVLFDERLRQQQENYAERLEGRSISEKIHILAEIRDQEGYMAEVEVDGNTVYLNEYNCPIFGVASEYPHACEAELRLFQTLLGVPVRRECHIKQGDHVCRYSVEI